MLSYFAKDLIEYRCDCFHINRLYNVSVHAAFKGFSSVLVKSVRRHCNDRNICLSVVRQCPDEIASLTSLVIHTIMRIFVTFFCLSSLLNKNIITPNIRVTHISLAASCTLCIFLPCKKRLHPRFRNEVFSLTSYFMNTLPLSCALYTLIL